MPDNIADIRQLFQGRTFTPEEAQVLKSLIDRRIELPPRKAPVETPSEARLSFPVRVRPKAKPLKSP